MTTEQIAFVTARLGEDETAANEALLVPAVEYNDLAMADILAYQHIVRHDPARALREVEAGRKLLREHERLVERKASHESHLRAEPHWTPFNRPGWPSAYDLQREGHFLEQALPLVRGLVAAKAAAYSDHPDYRQEWDGSL